MGLKFFDETSSGSGSLEFLADWLKACPKNKTTIFNIEEVVAVKSGKGYLVRTEFFQVFLWKKSKIANQLIEALKYYADNPTSGYGLFVALDKPNSESYKLAVDDEKPTTWFVVGNGYSVIEPVYFSEDDHLENPLLLKASS